MAGLRELQLNISEKSRELGTSAAQPISTFLRRRCGGIVGVFYRRLRWQEI